MSTNPRQIQTFEVKPIFVLNRCSGVDNYTFRLEKKDLSKSLVWEVTKSVSELEFDPINEQYLMFEYPKEEPPLNELSLYSISGMANSPEGSLYAQSDLFVFDSTTEKSFVELSEKIFKGKEEDLKNMFYGFIDNITMADPGTGTGGWYKGRPPKACYSLQLSLLSECG